MKPSWVFGKLNPLKVFAGYFDRHPWQRRLLVLAPFLILLALLNPVLGAADKLLSLVSRLLGPLLDTGVGRALLVFLLLLVAALVVSAVAKDRLLGVLRRYALSLHLRGIEALLLGDRSTAGRRFRRVVRIGRWVDLAKGPAAAFGSLSVDARIKLARIHLGLGEVKRARAWVARIPETLLRKRLALSFAELNARVFAAHPDHLAESVLQVLAASHAAWPAHPGIAELHADKLLEQGQDDRADEVLDETRRRTSKTHAPRIARRLAALRRDLARRSLHEGRTKQARRLLERSLQLEESEEALLLRADVHLADGELDAALSVLNGIGSPAAKQRLARLLRHDARPLDPRQLLRRVPRRDSLVALAEWYRERGEHRRATRALEVCLRAGQASPRVLALLACVKLDERAPHEATRALRRALATLESRAGG